jgi:predicted MFS family arabinose efflux permease
MAQPILDRHPRLSSALRGLTNSWVNSARNHAPVVARAAASVAVAHSVRTLASVEALFNASDHNGLFFNASDHHGMFFSWENFAEFEGTSITQEITEELPDDVHSGALYAVLGLSLVVLFGDVAFGYKCRETKMKRAANFSELSERLSELDAKLAQEEVAAATPVSLARSLSEQRLEHAKGRAMAVLLRDADQQAAATVPPRTREPEPQSPEEMAAEWHDFKRTKLRFLVLTCVLGFASELLLWMLAPFLPLVAKNKGVSPELVGVLFACHPIALGISSHLAPWLMRNIEPFVLLQRTLFLQAIFISGFGLAGGIESTVPFICCAAINRFMLGLMSGINEPTSQAITLRVVPTHAIGFAFGMIISSRFTAMLIGPALGGALYTAGGFPLPFMVSGCIYLFLGCLTMYVGISTPGDVSPPPGDVTVWTLVRVRGMPWMLGCIFLLWLNTMALEPLYQPQLARAPYKLSVLNVGLVLSSATGALVLTMSLSGHLSRMVDAYSQQTVGFVLLITALPFLGPEPGFHLDANVSLFVGAVSSSRMRPTRRHGPPLRLRLRLPARTAP